MNNINLVEVTAEEASKLDAMFQVYFSEMKTFLDQNDEKIKLITSADILKKYWEHQPTWPYLLVVDGTAAGFCLLRHYPGETATIDIAQYYVANEFRRQGVGAASLKKLLKTHPGSWLIRVMTANAGALKFWLKSVEACIGSSYEQKIENDNMHFIRFNTKDI